MRPILRGLFWLWRHTVGLLLPDACRFRPSCSVYASEAITHRGLVVGSALTVWRLLRCHPFHPGGDDPVPVSRPPCRRE